MRPSTSHISEIEKGHGKEKLTTGQEFRYIHIPHPSLHIQLDERFKQTSLSA
jgi:hypothetical protein